MWDKQSKIQLKSIHIIRQEGTGQAVALQVFYQIKLNLVQKYSTSLFFIILYYHDSCVCTFSEAKYYRICFHIIFARNTFSSFVCLRKPYFSGSGNVSVLLFFYVFAQWIIYMLCQRHSHLQLIPPPSEILSNWRTMWFIKGALCNFTTLFTGL